MVPSFSSVDIHMRAFALFFVASTSVLAACEGPVTRDCPAFGSTLADRWSTAFNEGDVIEFANQSGEVRTLRLESRIDSEPFTGSGRSSALICGVSSERRYVFDNSDIPLLIEINENILEDPDEESTFFAVFLRPESSAESSVFPNIFAFPLSAEGRLGFFPSEFEPVASDLTVSRFLDPLEVNGNPDGFAAEQKFVDTSTIFDAFVEASIDTNSPLAISRVVLADGGSAESDVVGFPGGLIEFETLNGDIYTRQ